MIYDLVDVEDYGSFDVITEVPTKPEQWVVPDWNASILNDSCQERSYERYYIRMELVNPDIFCTVKLLRANATVRILDDDSGWLVEDLHLLNRNQNCD